MTMTERVAWEIKSAHIASNGPAMDWYAMARAAIPIVIEECARIADRYTCTARNTDTESISRAIRALKERP